MVNDEKEQLKEKQFLWANKRSFIIPNHVAQIKEKYFIRSLVTKCDMAIFNVTRMSFLVVQ